MSEFIDNIHAVGAATREDLRDASWIERAKFTGSTALLGLHELGMETALVFAATHTAAYTHNNPVATGAATALLSWGAERILTKTFTPNLDTFPTTMDTIRDRYFAPALLDQKKEIPTRVKKISDGVDVVSTAFSLGSPGIIFRDSTMHPEKTQAELVKTGKRAGKGLAVFNGAWSATLASSGLVGEEFFHSSAVSDFIVEAADSPITYGLVFGVFLGMRIKNGIRARKLRRAARANPEPNPVVEPEAE